MKLCTGDTQNAMLYTSDAQNMMQYIADTYQISITYKPVVHMQYASHVKVLWYITRNDNSVASQVFKQPTLRHSERHRPQL